MAFRSGFRSVLSRLGWSGIGLMALAISSYAWAELVVLTDGRVVKAAGHQIVGDQLEIRLSGGGSYSVDRRRVDRIMEDEVAASDLPPPPPPARPAEKAPVAPVRVTPIPSLPPAVTPSDPPRGRIGMGRLRHNRTGADTQNSGMAGAPDALRQQ